MYMYMHVYKSVWMFQFAVGIDPFQRGTQDLLPGAVVMDPSSALAKPPETESPRAREQRLSLTQETWAWSGISWGIRGYYLYIYIYIYIHIHIYTPTYTGMYIYARVCLYMYVFIYVYTHAHSDDGHGKNTGNSSLHIYIYK